MKLSVSLCRCLVYLVVAASFGYSANANQQKNRIIPYQKIKPILRKVDLKRLNIKSSLILEEGESRITNSCVAISPNYCIVIGIDTNHNDDAKPYTLDYGDRLFLLEKTSRGFEIRYKSTGSRYDWSLTPSFYYHPTNGSVIILAENWQEELIEMDIFIFRQNSLAKIGVMDVSIAGESSARHTLVSQENNNIVFRFDRDMWLNVHNNPNGKEATLVKHKYDYFVYNDKVLRQSINGKLTLVVDMAIPGQEFPDRIVSSQKIRGKFIRSNRGDSYRRYVNIDTASGAKTFLLDLNELCFFWDNSRQQLQIEYQEIDRYMPDLGGYLRVNIIRNITSRNSNLKKWRKNIDPVTLAECHWRQGGEDR